MKRLNKKNIYYIVTAAKKANLAHYFIEEMVGEGANVFTIPTKSTLDFNLLDIQKLKKIKNNIVKTDWLDEVKLPKEDAILVAPCTFNSLNFVSSGVANSYPLCLIASSFSKKIPIFFAPAMNKDLWNHPITKENVKKIENWGGNVVWPKISENKITMMNYKKILDSLYICFGRINYKPQKMNSSKNRILLDKYKKVYVESFKKLGLFLKENDLNLFTAGFISIRVPEGILITRSGSDLLDLKEEDLSLILSWDENNNIINYVGDYLPSSESPLSCLIHSETKKTFILHFHCPRITYNKNYDRYKTKEYVRYGSFGTGRSALKLLNKENFCILKYHGEIIVEDKLKDLFNKTNKYI